MNISLGIMEDFNNLNTELSALAAKVIPDLVPLGCKVLRGVLNEMHIPDDGTEISAALRGYASAGTKLVDVFEKMATPEAIQSAVTCMFGEDVDSDDSFSDTSSEDSYSPPEKVLAGGSDFEDMLTSLNIPVPPLPPVLAPRKAPVPPPRTHRPMPPTASDASEVPTPEALRAAVERAKAQTTVQSEADTIMQQVYAWLISKTRVPKLLVPIKSFHNIGSLESELRRRSSEAGVVFRLVYPNSSLLSNFEFSLD